MRVAFDLIRKNFKTFFLHRIDFIGMLMVLSVIYSIRLAYLENMFQYADTLAGWSIDDVTFLLYVLMLSLIVTDMFENSVLRFFQKLAYGEADVFFIKPVSLSYYLFIAWVKPSGLFAIALVILAGTFYFDSHALQATSTQWLGFSAAFLVGILCNLLLIANISFLTVYLKRQVHADFVFSEITKVMIIPSTIFSRKIGLTLLIVLPSLFCATVPCTILLKNRYEHLGFMVIGFFALLATYGLNLYYTQRNYEGMGG